LPASIDSIRRDMEGHVQPTKQDKGLEFNLKITAYDNGMVSVNGRPINHFITDPDPGSHGWLGAAEVVVISLGEFRRRVMQRRAES
jgi:hypothetical protein